jgi:hypothetical protein
MLPKRLQMFSRLDCAIRQDGGFFVLSVAFLIVSLVCARPAWAEDAPVSQVGKAVFLTGQVTVGAQKGAARPMRQGDGIAEGDTVRTGADGHVYFRMNDNGFLAVRPNSQLRIEAYAWDSNDPSRNRIRLFTDKGVVRSVTGKAGSAARERFRMNTPVAAIGVRGTDFTVSSGEDVIHVSVLQGTVSVSPYGNGCDVNALGPCTGELARDIGENARDMALEVRHAQTPVQVPIENVPDLQKSQQIRLEEHGSTKKGIDAAQGEHETGNGQNAGAAQEDSALARKDDTQEDSAAKTPGVPGSNELRKDDVAVKEGIVQEDRDKQVDLRAGEVLSDQVPQVLEDHPRTAIWWGRWQAFVQPDETDRTIAELANVEGREVAVGNKVYSLFRDKNQPLPTDDVGITQFSLTESEAWVRTEENLLAAGVLDGELTIDFERMLFSTWLSVSETNRIHMLSASGRINPRGFFSDNGRSNTVIRGTVAAQGTQAGYVFSHPLDQVRELTGVTIWQR